MLDLSVVVPVVLVVAYVLRQALVIALSLIGTLDPKRTEAAHKMLKLVLRPRRRRRTGAS